MKTLLISVLIISLILVGCGGSEDSQEPDNSEGRDTSVETIEDKPVPAPIEEDTELEESVEDVVEPEEPEIPEADQGTNTYNAYDPEIVTFEMSDGILTVVADDGSRFGWNNNAEGFSISYPVAEDCVWETGYFEADFVATDSTDYESVKSYIEETQAGYIEYSETEDFEINSPMGLYIEVTDGVVVRVYTAFS